MSVINGGRLAAVVVAMAWLAAAQGAAPQQVTGWRGDGTGKYPDADPPSTWGRVSRAMSGLRCAVKPPADAAPAGRPMADGVAREWLVLGPVPFAKGTKIEEEAIPGEGQLDPEEGQKTGPGTWKKLTTDNAYLDFTAAIGKPQESVAFACTQVYSETAGAFRLNLTSQGNVRTFVNGKPVAPFAGRLKLQLDKGWNRILLKVAPGETDWYAVAVLHAWLPATYDQSGIAWHVALPGAHPGFYGGGQGVASPVIVGDRIYVPSEPFDLVCLNKSDGKVLWLRRHSYLEAATAEERQTPAYADAQAIATKIDAINAAFVAGTATEAQLQQKVELERNLQKEMRRVAPDKYAAGTAPDIGYSGFTPVTDGQSIYVWSASGVSVCYDLDGNRRWMRVERRREVEHGFSSSPVLVDGKLIVCMRDLMAFDAKTGEPAWTTPLMSPEGLNPGGFFHGTPLAAAVGGAPIISLGNGMIVRASDGRLICANKDAGNQSVASSVLEDGTIYQLAAGTLFVCRLPAAMADPLRLTVTKTAIDTSAFPKHYLPWHLCSPVVHDGLAYLVNNAGVLTVFDVRANQVVYQKMLDLDVFQAHNEGAARGIGPSPALAGGRIYLFGNNGAALVIEPGRTYKQIAKNKIEHIVLTGHWAERQERFMANPAFDGQRLYLRGEGGLWAIGPR